MLLHVRKMSLANLLIGLSLCVSSGAVTALVFHEYIKQVSTHLHCVVVSPLSPLLEEVIQN